MDIKSSIYYYFSRNEILKMILWKQEKTIYIKKTLSPPNFVTRKRIFKNFKVAKVNKFEINVSPF